MTHNSILGTFTPKGVSLGTLPGNRYGSLIGVPLTVIRPCRHSTDLVAAHADHAFHEDRVRRWDHTHRASQFREESGDGTFRRRCIVGRDERIDPVEHDHIAALRLTDAVGQPVHCHPVPTRRVFSMDPTGYRRSGPETS